jgi:hypothetical protein
LQIKRHWELAFGLDFEKFSKSIRQSSVVINEFTLLGKENLKTNDRWKLDFSNPHFDDKEDQSGKANGQYFFQDLIVARKIFERSPDKHVDVGSRVDGFVAHVAVFRKVEVFDIRPLTSSDPNILFRKADISKLDPIFFNYCTSLSCLHALEHFGLGRYSDEVDLEGYVKGLQGLFNMLLPGGILYLSVPIGKQRIEFNAHRIFSMKTILELIDGRFSLEDFAFVDDNGSVFQNVNLTDDDIQNNFGLDSGCGIFEFKKVNNFSKISE